MIKDIYEAAKLCRKARTWLAKSYAPTVPDQAYRQRGLAFIESVERFANSSGKGITTRQEMALYRIMHEAAYSWEKEKEEPEPRESRDWEREVLSWDNYGTGGE